MERKEASILYDKEVKLNINEAFLTMPFVNADEIFRIKSNLRGSMNNPSLVSVVFTKEGIPLVESGQEVLLLAQEMGLSTVRAMRRNCKNPQLGVRYFEDVKDLIDMGCPVDIKSLRDNISRYMCRTRKDVIRKYDSLTNQIRMNKLSK